MKRFLRGLALFVVMGLIFGLVGTLGMGSAFASSDTYVFKLAIEMPERHPYWMGATKFNELLWSTWYAEGYCGGSGHGRFGVFIGVRCCFRKI